MCVNNTNKERDHESQANAAGPEASAHLLLLHRQHAYKRQKPTIIFALAGCVVVDAAGVKDKGILCSVHRDCHGTFCEQGLFESVLTAIGLNKVALHQVKQCLAHLLLSMSQYQSNFGWKGVKDSDESNDVAVPLLQYMR